MNLLRLLLASSVLLAGSAPAQTERPRPAAGFGPWAEPAESVPANMRYATFASKLAGTDVSYVVYLPPGYEAAAGTRYPVVYWLHGRGGSQNGAGTFAGRLDAAIKAGKAPAMIVVGLNGRKTSSWVDSFDGKSPVQSVITQELIPHIDATYRTLPRREARAIEGFSMGGAGAPKLGFQYPELFGVVGVISGALHDLASYSARGTALQDIYGGNAEYYEANSPWNVVAKNADAIRGRTFVRVAVGDKDDLAGRNTAYHELLAKLRIEHEFDIIPGATHNTAQVYDGLGDKTWTFYAKAFAQATPPTPMAAAPGARGPAGRRNPDAPQAAPTPAGPIKYAVSPSVTDVAYGSHPSQVFDLWLAKSDKPTPLVLFIHGGGFIGGSRGELNQDELKQLLEAGISVASVEYRVLAQAKLPAAHADAVRALQYMRAHARQWNIDKTRVAAFGGSAGAQLCMYLAFHDDLADPKSSDPVARESTRLTCIAPAAGQITMDMNWWRANVPDALASRTNAELFGTDNEAEAMKINAGIAAISLISADDPPVFMSYGIAPGQPYPADERRARQIKIHHVVHGVTLKKLCDQLGVEAHLKHPGSTNPYPDGVAFMKAKLLAAKPAQP